MTTDLPRLRERARGILLRRLRKRAAGIVANRAKVGIPTFAEPPAPVVNLAPGVLAVSAPAATLLAERTELRVETLSPVVHLSPQIAVAPADVLVNVEAPQTAAVVAAIDALAERVAGTVERLIAALATQKPPSVTVQPARVVLPERPPLVLRLETDSDGTRRVVQEEG